ncbi:PQQ-binding-like beta-propeller repeat protein [Luteolibacter marinus]|uniref:outer membrane protein assembly factor BamB family protein n=1 Tax=Luteolibacter marinus TaxID=2776705 RepID=UPI0018680611|nr:PQQ-binding-like beta-propeller repeat protein [Luteolibacter marinus]
MKILHLPISFGLVVAGSLSPLAAADVPAWRNGGNGLYPGAQPALDWTDASRVAWEKPLAAPSNGCPILVDGKLFFTAEPATLVCADAQSGEILWQKPNEYVDLIEMTPGKREEIEAAKAKAAELSKQTEPLERELYRAQRRMRRDRGNQELRAEVEELRKRIDDLKKTLGPVGQAMDKPPAHDVNGYSSYTPVSDGKRVWACFGIGVVVCYDLDGKRLWHKRTDNPDHDWGGATSPTLVDGKLIIRFGDYVALDPADGSELWRAPAGGVTFNAPASFEVAGKHYLYTCRGELFRVSDGKKLPSQDFRTDAKPWCFFNTPSVIGNRIYTAHGCEGEQGDAYCLEIPASAEALEKDGLKQVWHTEVDKNRYYSSPLVHDGIVYLISREYWMQALDAASGEVFYKEKVKGFTGTAYPSLTLAGDVIFVGAEDGNAAFVKPGKDFAEVSRTKVEPFRSTPIFDGDLCYLRTQEKLRAFRSE